MAKKPLIISIIVIVCMAFIFLIVWFLVASKSVMEIIPLVLSATAIIISILTFFRIQKTNTMPVLVFVHKFKKTWQIQNVGNGPALNSLIGDRTPDGKWNVILYSPIAAGASLDLVSSENKTEFGAVYNDIRERTYSSHCIHNISKFFERNKFPDWKSYITEAGAKEIRDEVRKYF